MAIIEKFLGVQVTIPENLRYLPEQGLWARAEQASKIVFGFTEPALTLAGALNAVDWLVEPGQMVAAGTAIVFVFTEKPIYLDAPASGFLQFNDRLKERPVLAKEDPYGEGWLFKMSPEDDVTQLIETFVGARHYIQSLKHTDGFRNPEGLKGSGPCACKRLFSTLKKPKGY